MTGEIPPKSNLLIERTRDFITAFITSDRNPAKRINLLEPGKKLDQVNRQSKIFQLGLDAWWRQTFVRSGRRWSLEAYGINDVKDFLRSIVSLSSFALEGLMFAGELALSGRIGNEFTQLDIQRGKVGGLFDQAREKPADR